MPGSPYSPYKIFHHPLKIAELREGKQIVPLMVQLIISDLCNQNCAFCCYRMPDYPSNQMFAEHLIDHSGLPIVNNNPNRTIPTNKILEILDDCVEMKIPAIEITGGGEPTVHPDFLNILKAIHARKLELGLVTNGYIFKPGVTEELIKAKWIRISIDAGSAWTYQKVRGLNKTQALDHVRRNVTRLVQEKRNTQSDVIIGLGYVVTKENYHEIEEFIKWASLIGVDNVRYSACFTSEDFEYHRNHFDETSIKLRHIVNNYSRPDFKIFNLFGERIDDLKQHRPDYTFCGYEQLMTYIGGDQNVYRCCNTAYNEQGLLGSIKNMRFKDFWNSQQKKQRIQNFDASSCPRCMFNNKNRVINYLLDPDPTHKNFI